MEINADFDQRIVLHAAHMPWVDSPMQGVQRRMLDRIGNEVARATSIVRYAPDSQFSPHTHDGGEEFIVLEGVFQDEHGDYPAGTYVRNPPTSRHTPRSSNGCIIFVKLWQFDPADRHHCVIDMNHATLIPDTQRPGVGVIPLFQDGHETVRLEVLVPGTHIEMACPDGAELLVLAGEVEVDGDLLSTLSWMRLPKGDHLVATAGTDYASVWIKTGHLGRITTPHSA